MSEHQSTGFNARAREAEVAKLTAENLRLREALRRARHHSVASTMFHAGEAWALARWIDAGMSADLPEIASPIVREDMARG